MAPKTPPQQLERVRARNLAVKAAISRLIDAHPDEWETIYTEEALRAGVTPRRK